MPVIREPYKIFAACLNFYRSNPALDESVRNSSMFKAIEDSLRYYLTGLSILHQGAYPGWAADIDYPGYLIRVDFPYDPRSSTNLTRSAGGRP